MEKNPSLLAFQGVIISANLETPFERIQYRGGNEESILSIVSKCYEFLEEKNFLNDNGITENGTSEMRRYFFYLILNANFESLTYLADGSNVEEVIWTVSTVSNVILTDLISGLSMDCFLEEAIESLYPPLAVDIFETFVDYIKNVSINKYHKYLALLLKGGYKMMCRLILFDPDKVDVQRIAAKASELFAHGLNYFTAPPNAQKLETMKRFELYNYQGETLKSLIEITNICYDVFKTVPKFKDTANNIFLLSVSDELLNNSVISLPVCNLAEGTLLQCLEKCNEQMLDIISNVMLLVTVDVYCCWSETDLPNGTTLQMNIGELTFKLLEHIESNQNLSNHIVKQMLSPIAVKPTSLNDIINSADDETLIENVFKCDEFQRQWLSGIIHKQDFLKNEKLAECLLAHIQNYEDLCGTVFEQCKEIIMSSEAPSEAIKLLAVVSFAKLGSEIQRDVLNEIFAGDLYHNKFETSLFEAELTETFNKLLSNQITNLDEIHKLFIQNSKQLFQKLINVASKNQQQCTHMIGVLKHLKSYQQYKYADESAPTISLLMEQELSNRTESQNSKVALDKLFAFMKKESVIDSEKFLLIILNKVHKPMLEKDFMTLNLLIAFLENYSIEELKPLRSPILALLGQLMDKCRWTIKCYSADAVVLLSDVIKLQSNLISSFAGSISDRDKNWLKSNLSLNPANKYYFRIIWDINNDDFLDVTAGTANIATTQGFQVIAKVLSSCTPLEWASVFISLANKSSPNDAMDNILKVVMFLIKCCKENGADSTLEYYVGLFAMCCKKHYLGNPQVDTARLTLENVAKLSNCFAEEQFETCGNILLTLVSFMFEKAGKELSDLNLEIDSLAFAKSVDDVMKNSRMNGS